MNTFLAIPRVSPRAIVICCSDPRLQTTFEEFLYQELGLAKGDYAPLVVAGGAGAMARPYIDPYLHDFDFMADRIRLFCRHFPSTIQRIIFINHEDCAYYKHIAGRTIGVPSYYDNLPLHDAKLILQVFSSNLSSLGLQVEFYYARFTDATHTKVAFEKVS